MCKNCLEMKYTAAQINNTNADTIYKMASAAATLSNSSMHTQAAKVAEALVQLLPSKDKPKVSGETNQATGNGPNPHYKGDAEANGTPPPGNEPKDAEPREERLKRCISEMLGLDPREFTLHVVQ